MIRRKRNLHRASRMNNGYITESRYQGLGGRKYESLRQDLYSIVDNWWWSHHNEFSDDELYGLSIHDANDIVGRCCEDLIEDGWNERLVLKSMDDISDILSDRASEEYEEMKTESRKKGMLENIKPVKSVSRGYDKERTIDIASKIYRYFKFPEYALYSENQNLYFDRPKVCKIQVFCYGDGRCVVKLPEGDKYEVYNREENDTIFEISSLIKDYFAQNQDLD